jgi:transposase-like protein
MFSSLPPLTLATIAERYGTEETARAFFEAVRWPKGAICPHCACMNAYKVGKNLRSLKHSRPGLWYCRECKDQFTVTEGTVMERSHIPLNKWLMAIYLLTGSKKGMSAHQLHRELDLSYKAAFFMAHRIRYAMTQEPIKSKLGGIVEVDETWVGGKERGKGRRGKTRETKKQIVVSLVQRGGEARSYHVKKVTADQLRGLIRKHVPAEGTVFTDSWSGYNAVDEDIETHETVNHAQGEYARGIVNTNTVEGYFSILKRGVYGVYHHVSENHFHRYLAEFDYRYTRRKATDGERAIEAIKMTQGKRLTYRQLPAERYAEAETEGPARPTTKD